MRRDEPKNHRMFEAEEMAAEVRFEEAIGRLTEKPRMVIRAHRSGLSLREIAYVLNISPQRAGQILGLAMKAVHQDIANPER